MQVSDKKTIYQIFIGLLIVGALFSIYLFLSDAEILALLKQREAFMSWIVGLGLVGPFAIIGLMMIAIVISPLPSAPIALVAGAAYGHGWGTLYVLLGAELGALIAFTVARLLGYSVLHHWFGVRLKQGWIGSQNTIMFIVFASRLLPFLSFDLISYAAGLTNLKPWRFAMATLLGILPASFVLAHFGSEFGSGDADRILLTIGILGILTLIPLIIRSYLKQPTTKSDENP